MEKDRFLKEIAASIPPNFFLVQFWCARYGPKIWNLFIFCVDLGWLSHICYLDYSLQGWIKILDRLAEFSFNLYIQTRS